MSFILPALVALAIGGFSFRLWYRSWKQRQIAAKRRIEAPNSYYSSSGVRHQEDRERWGAINLRELHPLNRDEVSRLLDTVDVNGVKSLSPRERLFLDNMTLTRQGV
jgi:hypothetical protein